MLIAAWWGVDAFVLSADLPGGGPDAAVPIERMSVRTEQDAGDGSQMRTEASADEPRRSPVRLDKSRDTTDTTRAPATEVAARRSTGRAGSGASSGGADEAGDSAGRLLPGRTGTRRSDDVIVGNTYTIADDDEVWVERGYAWVGTPREQVEGLLGTRGENVPPGIRYEAPRHAVLMDGYWIDRTEVTNRRYLRFLQQAARVEFTTPLGKARSPMEITAALVGPRARDEWDLAATARQLVEANVAAVYAAVPELVVRDPATRAVDADATWENLRDAPLPNDVTLRFYDRAPPAHWPDDRFVAGRVDHPVRGLSLADATALALWAGRHVPTELEWEYAARGPRGLERPWGTRPRRFEDLVNGGRVLKHGEVAETTPVRAYPEGASWVGALNLLGNVAEWTSSRLIPYPESGLRPRESVVYRGGSAADEEPLAVRSAFRGWTPTPSGDARPPAWNRPRPWVGVRLARYEEPARSQTVAARTRYLANPELPEDALELRVYAGARGVLEGAPLGSRRDPSVRPGVKSVVVQPLRYAVAVGPDDPHVPGAVVDEGGLLALSDSAFVVLGLLHTDLQLLDVWAREPRTGRRPALRRVAAGPGTWLVGLHAGHLALADPARPVMVYLTRTPAGRATVGVHSRSPRRDGRPHLDAALGIPQGARLDVGLELPLGNPARPELVVRVRFDLRFELRVLQAIRDWEAGSLRK